MKNIKIIDGKTVRENLPMNLAIPAMKRAFRIISEGTATVPKRIHLDLLEAGGGTLTMPVYVPELRMIGTKIISIFPDNSLNNLPVVQAVMLILDAENGTPIAIMDGAELTAIRTGAASGIATEILALPEANCVAIFGAGIQGRAQLEAICTVRPITRVLIYDSNRNSALEFKHEMSKKLNINIELGHFDNLREAQIVCTATSSKVPVFQHMHLAPGTHINAIGSYKPDVQEIPAETIQHSRIYVDKLSSVLEESGDLIIPITKDLFKPDDIIGEIGDLISGKLIGRENETEITLFKSVGNAVQDLVAAAVVLKNLDL